MLLISDHIRHWGESEMLSPFFCENRKPPLRQQLAIGGDDKTVVDQSLDGHLLDTFLQAHYITKSLSNFSIAFARGLNENFCNPGPPTKVDSR